MLAIFHQIFKTLAENAQKTPKIRLNCCNFSLFEASIVKFFGVFFEFLEFCLSFAKNFEFFVKNGPEFRENFGKKAWLPCTVGS